MGNLLLFVLLMASLYSGRAEKGLECENDMLQSITCTWDGVPQDQSKCKMLCKSRHNTYECDLKKLDGNITQCILHIYDNTFSTYTNKSYNLSVTCEDDTKPVEEPLVYIPRLQKVRPPPPEMPTIENTTLRWMINASRITTYLTISYELQQRTQGQAWEDSQLIEGTSCLLDEDGLVRGQQYWARVRAKYQSQTHPLPQAEWSAWSPTVSWVSTVGHPPVTPPPVEELESWLVWWAVVGAVVVLVFLVVIMFLGTRTMKSSFIPNPSKYFDGLDSIHKGNFKAWLGSILTLDALGMEVQSEYTSPVEVLKEQKSCKSFSNNQYFHKGQKSGKLLPPPLPPLEPLEPCHEFSGYNHIKGDVDNDASVDQDSCHSGVTDSDSTSTSTSTSGGNGSRTHVDLGPIQLCSSYRDLTRLRAGAQSPDSGVSMASVEEESQEESLEGNSHGQKSPLDHPITFSFPKPAWTFNRPGGTEFFFPMTSQPLSLAHPCGVPFSGMCLDMVSPDLCSTPTGWSHKQNPLDSMYGELEPCNDDYQPLQTS